MKGFTTMEQQQDSPSNNTSNNNKSHQYHNESLRYVHDIEQAIAMRQPRRRPQAAAAGPCSPTSTTSSSSLGTSSTQNSNKTAEAISLGLRGLDEADVLQEQGHLQCALDLYQSAIEVLIKTIRDEMSLRRNGYDRVALEERIKVGLNDAENLKLIIKQQQSTCETSSESPMKKTCFSKIKEYLASMGNSSSLPSTATGTVTRNHNLNYTSSNANHSNSRRNVAAVKQIQVQKQSSNKQLAVRKQQHRQQNIHQQQQSTKHNNNNTGTVNHVIGTNSGNKEKELLTKTIMQDIYVPQSQLQTTTWDDIAGLSSAKQALQEAAIMPLLRPDLFTGLRKPQNILLYGAPGTGKTLLVKAVASESQCSLFLCSSSAMTSKWQGESEKLIRELFNVARQYSPSIIFVDEVDALLQTRKSDGEHEASRRFKTEFMTNMDGISNNNSNNSNVLLIACTNCPWDIDSAILRRFSRRIFIPLPDKDARKALIKALLKNAGKHSIRRSEISDLAKSLKGYSGADISSIASEASFGPLRDVGNLDAIRSVKASDVRPIDVEDFEKAISQATKSVSKEQLAKYEDWKKEQS